MPNPVFYRFGIENLLRRCRMLWGAMLLSASITSTWAGVDSAVNNASNHSQVVGNQAVQAKNVKSPEPAQSSQAQSSSECAFAPNWIMPTVNGETLALYDIADTGKTTVMVFWSTWCKTCKQLLPKLQTLSKEQSSSKVSIVLMNLWEDSDPVAYLEEHKLQFPAILQAEQVAQRYEIRMTPGVVVVDKEKQIRYVRPAEDGVNDVLEIVKTWMK